MGRSKATDINKLNPFGQRIGKTVSHFVQTLGINKGANIASEKGK